MTLLCAAIANFDSCHPQSRMSEWDKDTEKTAPTKMNVTNIKIIFDPTTTSMKIPTTSDEDTASLLYPHLLPHNLTRRQNNYSNNRTGSPNSLVPVMGPHPPPSGLLRRTVCRML